jgi:putative tricarboxylic transport membrane protein
MFNFIDAVLHILQPHNLLLLVSSTLAGVIIGAMPGLTSTIAIGLLIPLTFTVSHLTAFIMLVAIYCGAMYGGSIPGILLNLPGTPTAVISAIDGIQMTRKGEGGRALGISAISSSLGGIVSAVFLIFLSKQLSAIALLFAGPEYFSLAVFSLCVVIALAGSNLLKGLISVGLGLLLASIGIDATTPVARFTFGIQDIIIGIPAVPATIGLFCVAEAFRMVVEPMATSTGERPTAGMLVAIRDIPKLLPTILRSSLIGTFIGALPGAGSVTAAFLSYGEARRRSNTPEEFGKGALEGVAAPEAANNAVTGGALIPMLTLGIPGDTNTLMMLGAMFVQGLVPGPTLFRNEPLVVNAIFVTIIFASLLILPLGLFCSHYIARIALIDRKYLLPFVLILAIAGPSISYGHIYYFWITIIFGFGGYILQKAGFSVLALGLALILGPLLESNLRSGLMMSDGNAAILFTRPISLGLLLMSAAVLIFGICRDRFSARLKLPAET